MNKFATVNELKHTFLSGNVVLTKTIVIDNTEYKFKDSTSTHFKQLLDNKPSIVVYESSANNSWVALVWTNKNCSISPTDVQQLNVSNTSINEAEGNKLTISPKNIIGDTVSVTIKSIDVRSVKGKVDTGAEISSLHVDKYEINSESGRVKFTSKVLSPNIITLPLYDHQAVKSANGVQYRPVVELDVKINDRVIPNVLFNLSDRAHMDYPILIGKNVLEKGKFLIDPSLSEQTINWEVLTSVVTENLPAVEPVVDDETIKEVYDLLKNKDVKFSDLIKYIKTEITESFNDLEH